MSANQIKPSSLLAPGKEGDSNPQLTMKTANDNTNAIPLTGSTTNLILRRETSVEVSQNNKPMPPGINPRSSMTRKQKLNQIKTLWNRKVREYEWEDIEFGPDECCCESFRYNLIEFRDNVERKFTNEGFYLWVWGRQQNIRGWLTWDLILLSWIQAWFYLPEEYDAVLFINEAARVICISTPRHAARFASLFQKPHSALLGAKISDVEKEVQTLVGALALPPIATTQVAPSVPASPEVAS